MPATKYIGKAEGVKTKQIPEYNQTKRRHSLIKTMAQHQLERTGGGICNIWIQPSTTP
jgi:hypothetical protein